MIGNIRNSFIDRLNQATWMDNDSKAKAIDKVNSNKCIIQTNQNYILGECY
jgi:predicted metalloendopeptidase